MSDCAHERFDADVIVDRLLDSGTFICTVKVRCAQCGEAFRFLGAPAAIMAPHPHVNIDGTELSVKIEPEGEKRLAARSPVYMPKLPEKA